MVVPSSNDDHQVVGIKRNGRYEGAKSDLTPRHLHAENNGDICKQHERQPFHSDAYARWRIGHLQTSARIRLMGLSKLGVSHE
jgi:hypothetical protein